MTWSSTIATFALGLGLLGCAGGTDPVVADTDTDGSTSATVSATSPTTMTASTTTASTTTTTTTSATMTTEPQTSSSSSGADDSSSSTDPTTTTDEPTTTGECVPRTEGCPCAPDADPECGDGLTCSRDDICVATACDAVTGEPNDDPFEPSPLELPEKGPGLLDAELDGDTDVDWWIYSCSDPLLGSIDPGIASAEGALPSVCVYMDCQQGSNPTFDCPEGTTEDTAPIGFLPGCCTEGLDALSIDNHNCPESSNDAVDVYLRIDGGIADMCVDYSLAYACE